MPEDLPAAATPAWFGWLDRATDAEKAGLVASMNQRERNRWRHTWPVWARRAQLAPEGNWRTWLILAGRGFGKTRAGAEWVQQVPHAPHRARRRSIRPGQRRPDRAAPAALGSPLDGMQVLDRSRGQILHRLGGTWRAPALPSMPTGGSVVDVQARQALNTLVAALQQWGVFAA